MAELRTYDVLIAGAGPAGLAAALYLLRERPQLAGHIGIIEKERHPRFKVCAGGLIPKTLASLKDLALEIEVPSFSVYGGVAQTPIGTVDLGFDRQPLCTVVRRDQFDASLARAAIRRGAEVIESTRIERVAQTDREVCLETNRGAFHGKVLIGADGSGSRVRRDLFGQCKKSVARALMVDVAVDPEKTEEFAKRIYRFAFDCIGDGAGGYSWSFPCLIDDRAHLNLGIYEYRGLKRITPSSTPPLRERLALAFPAVGSIADGRSTRFKGFPIRWFDPCGSLVAGRAILAGDAAGVDPFMGEGISYAFEYGQASAKAVARFLAGDRLALRGYERKIREGSVGRKLGRLGFAARRFYGPRHRLYFRLAALSRVAQRIGVDWYNGARGVDELSIPQVLAKWTAEVALRRIGKPE
jgi:flavin-dependent dehydrogenase